MCSSAYRPLLADQPTAPVSGCGQPQAELHSVHSFLYFPIGTNVIGLLCTSYKYRKRYKQGAESLLVADWSKIGHLNKRLGEPAASAGVRFTTRCRALTAGLSLTLNLTTNSTIPVSQPLSCVSLSCANLSLSLMSQFSQWSSSIETTSSDHECKQEAAGA